MAETEDDEEDDEVDMELTLPPPTAARPRRTTSFAISAFSPQGAGGSLMEESSAEPEGPRELEIDPNQDSPE